MEELGFVDYMLLTWDVINFCKENDIPIGLGRGSAAGSFVLFLLGITNLDPIKYSLFFERFISKIRAKKQVVDGVTYLDGNLMVDIDNDVIADTIKGKGVSYMEDVWQYHTIIPKDEEKLKIGLKELS